MEFRKSMCMSRERHRLRKDYKKTLNFHLQLLLSTVHPIITTTRYSNPEEERESYFQNYHIIKFIYSVFKKENKGIQRNMAHSEEQNQHILYPRKPRCQAHKKKT